MKKLNNSRQGSASSSYGIAWKFGVIILSFIILAAGISYLGLSNMHKAKTSVEGILDKDLELLKGLDREVRGLLENEKGNLSNLQEKTSLLLVAHLANLSGIAEVRKEEDLEKRKILEKVEAASSMEKLLIRIHEQLRALILEENPAKLKTILEAQDANLQLFGTNAELLGDYLSSGFALDGQERKFKEEWAEYIKLLGEARDGFAGKNTNAKARETVVGEGMVTIEDIDGNLVQKNGKKAFETILANLAEFQSELPTKPDPRLLEVENLLLSMQDQLKSFLLNLDKDGSSILLENLEAAQLDAAAKLESMERDFPAPGKQKLGDTLGMLEDYYYIATAAVELSETNSN